MVQAGYVAVDASTSQLRLHRPTIVLALLCASALLSSGVWLDDNAETAKAKLLAALPTTTDDFAQMLPTLIMSAVALSHVFLHDLVGKQREDYLRWAAWCRYAESRVVLNLMRASMLYAAASQAKAEPNLLPEGFSGNFSNLVSVALVVQHYVLTNSAIQSRRAIHHMLSLLLWAVVAYKGYEAAAATSAVTVMQALFLTKAVWYAYMPQHFADGQRFSPWWQLTAGEVGNAPAGFQTVQGLEKLEMLGQGNTDEQV